MTHAAIEFMHLAQRTQRGFQVPMGAAVAILVVLIVLGVFLWRLRRDR